ncbi:hypothetical protein N802_16110 [Knoellia sinensis KCTC 19936]|uniref:Uncharacterized protein n=1 Tax=Knoellia sinensis KCTC 19936 TaxID=1385520 RepID=A0A0A0J8I0_9MICO|nr:hypothetical protein [Knoellia sinensis]KGN33019.1 hypothetical protein N802_16110 [Knoellia sinensis KCTC 19936]
MFWNILGNAVLVLLFTLIVAAFITLVVEILRDWSFGRTIAAHDRVESNGHVRAVAWARRHRRPPAH